MKTVTAEMLTFPLVSGVLHLGGPSLKWATNAGTPVTEGLALCSNRDFRAWEGCMRIIHSLALTWKQLEDKRNARDIYQVTMSSHGLG